MGDTAVAFCPGHISGYFRRVTGDLPETTGSVGAGIVIDEGVRARAEAATSAAISVLRLDRSGRVIERQSSSPILESLLHRLDVHARITTTCRLPIGAGYGLSAAALLATATALNRLCNLGMSLREIAAHAHATEILHQSGLGDVAACLGGGMACRHGPGISADVTRMYDQEQTIAAVTLSPLPTSAVLGSASSMERVAAAFPGRCPADFIEFFSMSRGFAEHSGLISPEVREVLDACDARGMPASMTMLGNGVFAGGVDAPGILAPFGEVFRLRVSRTGVSLMEGEP